MVLDLVSKLRNLGVQVKCFSVIGIHLLADRKSFVVRRPVLFVYLFSCVCLTFVSKLWFAISKYEGIGKFAENIIFFGASAFGFGFIVMYIPRSHRFTTLIEDIEQLTATVSPPERVEINVQSRREKLLSSILCILLGLVVAIAYIPPLADGIISMMRDKKINVASPMLGSYPDNTNPNFYIVSCLVNGSMITFSVTLAAGFNSLFSRFESFGMRLENSHLGTEDDRTFNEQLRSMLAYYSTLNSFIKRLDNLFAPLLFPVVSYSVGQLCLVSFQIRVAESLSDSLVMIMVTLSILAQTMMFCFGGQVIKNHSDILCEKIYLSIPWHVLKKPMARSLIITLNRTQSGNCLTGYFFRADCELFVKILKAASSYYAVFAALKDAE